MLLKPILALHPSAIAYGVATPALEETQRRQDVAIRRIVPEASSAACEVACKTFETILSHFASYVISCVGHYI